MLENPPGPPARPRPVSVAGPPARDLAADTTRAWLAGLIESRPLEQADSVNVADLAREGPALCAAVLAAAASDSELEWLIGSPEGAGLAAAAVRATGATGPDGAVTAVEALRTAIWVTVSRAGPPDPATMAAIGHRLAHVCALLAARAAREASASSGERQEGAAGAGGPRAADDVPAFPGADHDLRAVPDPPPPAPGRPLWMGALERRLAEGGRSGRRFVLLLLDVDDAARLRAAQPPGAVDEVMADLGRAIREQVRREDLLAHEDERVWVVAQDTGRAGARALAARLSRAVQGIASWRGAPLTASVGMAVYPDDGRDVASLTDRAEEDMYGARAGGAPMADFTGSGR